MYETAIRRSRITSRFSPFFKSAGVRKLYDPMKTQAARLVEIDDKELVVHPVSDSPARPVGSDLNGSGTFLTSASGRTGETFPSGTLQVQSSPLHFAVRDPVDEDLPCRR